MIKVIIHPSKDGQFYFTIVRGQVSVTSETYTEKSNAKRAAKNLINGIWSTQMDDVKYVDETK